MPITSPLFINTWAKGTNENANIGTGVFLGVETYSTKGVAKLTKDTTKVSGSVVTDLPIYFTEATPLIRFAQGDTGKIYKSIDGGNTWTDITNAGSSGQGEGLMYYFGFVFAFRGTQIDYLSSPYTAADWTSGWKTNNPSNFPLITGQHFPFINPGDGKLYFGNGNYVGLISYVTDPSNNTQSINPAGTIGVDYLYSTGPSNDENGTLVFGLVLPQTYNVNCISFLPNNYLALGTGYSGVGPDDSISDVILWNPTIQTYNSPLRLYANGVTTGGTGYGGIGQIINRNNVLYAVTIGNQAVFQTNGQSFGLVADLSLFTTSRFVTAGNTNGIQSTSSILLSNYPSAIAVQGNKLLTAASTSGINGLLPTGYGIFPIGVWTIGFTEEGPAASVSQGKTIQCEFPLSSGIVCSNSFSIGAISPISNGQILVGWFDGTNYGIDKTEFVNYQNDPSVVQIESQMMEIGTPLEPTTITTIQINVVRSLVQGQEIIINYRSAFDQPYTPVPAGTFNVNSGNIQNNNSLKCVISDLGATKYLQLRIDLSTDNPNLVWTPEIRNVIIQ